MKSLLFPRALWSRLAFALASAGAVACSLINALDEVKPDVGGVDANTAETSIPDGSSADAPSDTATPDATAWWAAGMTTAVLAVVLVRAGSSR